MEINVLTASQLVNSYDFYINTKKFSFSGSLNMY